MNFNILKILHTKHNNKIWKICSVSTVTFIYVQKYSGIKNNKKY